MTTVLIFLFFLNLVTAFFLNKNNKPILVIQSIIVLSLIILSSLFLYGNWLADGTKYLEPVSIVIIGFIMIPTLFLMALIGVLHFFYCYLKDKTNNKPKKLPFPVIFAICTLLINIFCLFLLFVFY